MNAPFPQPETEAAWRSRAVSAETALADATALIADLNAQLDCANEAATRLARRLVTAATRRAA